MWGGRLYITYTIYMFHVEHYNLWGGYVSRGTYRAHIYRVMFHVEHIGP